MSTKRVIATISAEADERLREIQEETGAPIAFLVRKAIDEYLDKHGKPVNEKVQRGGYRRQQRGKKPA